MFDISPLSDSQGHCHGISDLEYLELGVEGCLSAAKSGNDFLQTYRRQDGQRVSVSHFFESLKSKRRLANLQSVNHLSKSYLADHIDDELAQIEELKDWHLYAGDGHYHKAAIFDSKTKADLSRKEPGKSATGYFFRLDLRTHHLEHLALAQPADGKKSEHDMKMLKRQDLQTLRGDTRPGQKSFYFWDRAILDYAFWNRANRKKGSTFALWRKAMASPNSSANTAFSTPKTRATKASFPTASWKHPKAMKSAKSSTSARPTE